MGTAVDISAIAPLGWVLLVAGCLVIGFSKTAFAGVGLLATVAFAFALPTRASTGAVLPMLILADVVAVALYRRHAHWKLLVRLLPWMLVGLALGAVFLDVVDDVALRRFLGVLLLLLRAVLAPVLLVATVLATYAASLGASWWIFTGVLGFDALDAGTPLLAFVFLVALGVDYNIFLVTRAREEAAEHGSREGMLRALTVTGGVITSAGILLAAVFAVLGVLPLVVLAQLGTIICVGVLLDTLVVRTVLVPALALLLGDRFWWPRRLSAPSAPAR